ncbi:hypothetical protein MTR67_048536 [Solanum verrucosum]|uniref:Uncharacterized protein n=1 Tax=Solanum verrucosum TaxID=315347 RepID=A0AAF0V1T0_SOLVR|nr:hypothetical protein MTR67_048536 [Solanum verrucosum]
MHHLVQGDLPFTFAKTCALVLRDLVVRCRDRDEGLTFLGHCDRDAGSCDHDARWIRRGCGYVVVRLACVSEPPSEAFAQPCGPSAFSLYIYGSDELPEELRRQWHPLMCDNDKVMKYSMGMEAKHRMDMASRTPSFGVGLYDTGFHSFLSWSMLVNAYSHHVRCALWLLKKFYV